MGESHKPKSRERSQNAIKYILYNCSYIKKKVKVAQSRPILWDTIDLHSPWTPPGQNTRAGSLSLLQETFPTRDRTQVSHIAGGFFTSWATREVLLLDRWRINRNSGRFCFLWFQNHRGWWLQPWNESMLASRKESYDKSGQCIKKAEPWLC